MKLRLAFLLLTGGWPLFLLAQENLGPVQDNYSPVNAGLLNPSALVDQSPWLDINIIGISAYTRNNSLYLPNTHLLRPSTYPEVIARNPQEKLYGYASAMVLGPSFSIALGDHAVGFHSAARGYVFIKNVPDPTATLLEEFQDTRVADGLYYARNIRAKGLAWEEYGLTYGRIIYKRNKNLMSAAITINRLLGASAAGIFISNGELQVNNQEGTLINLNGKYWYNEPARKAGKGFSGSIGYTFKKMKKDISSYVPHSVYGSCVVAEYKYKIGVSLVDIGAINFNRNALYKNFDENTSLDTIDDLADASEEALAMSDNRRFLAWLPAAASLQFDYNLENNFYFNATMVQRVAVPGWFGTERASLYSAGFRYERKAATIAVPFSLHEYRYTQLGLSLRLWSIIIGTDNLLPLIRRQDVYAADLYVYTRIPIFKSPPCRDRKEKEYKNKGVMEKFLCPVW